jgi:teichuronic acid biosynthesis glycosyltransferase TuaC
MKILTFTTLFPNADKPGHGIFVETRLRHLIASGEVESRVVAPIPWFPFDHPRFGRYASFARAPQKEVRSGLSVIHPRYLSLPKVGMTMAPFLLAKAAKPVIGRMIDEGFDFDLIDAHYFYPDGVAAAALGRHFNKPVVITARGSDITQIARYRLPRKMIRSACAQAAGVITVCNALKEEILRLGVAPARVTSLRNGVDLQRFHPVDRETARAALNLTQFTLLSVGHLVSVKGHDLTIAALPLLPDVKLLIAGDGTERRKLEALSRTLGVADRVTFLGAVPQQNLTAYYGAADALVLASSREGWANVLLESMACGTPVVASNVWGTPEVVAALEAGMLMSERTPAALAKAVTMLRASYPDRAATRRYAEKFSWADTTSGQLQLFRRIIEKNRGSALASQPATA